MKVKIGQELMEEKYKIKFANGGDRKKTNTPEVDVCNQLGIELLWGVGGTSKTESSSDLVERVRVRTEIRHSDR